MHYNSLDPSFMNSYSFLPIKNNFARNMNVLEIQIRNLGSEDGSLSYLTQKTNPISGKKG
jgi:hypothetical protein